MSLVLDRVCFSYPEGPVVFEDADLTFDQGAYFLVRGPSGVGKSTLLRLLCQLEEADSGTISYKGKTFDTMTPAGLRRTVAYVQQMPTLLKGTVRDNLLLPFSFQANAHLSVPSDVELAEYLESFLLSGVTLDSEGDKLSVGQSQRVCLIRSLLLRPEVVLMDEPTASLDSESAAVVLDVAEKLSGDGVTVIMISHSEITPPGVNRIVTINNHRLVLA